MPRRIRKKEEESWCDVGPGMWFKKKMWMHNKMMNCSCDCGCMCHKGHKLASFILAVSVIWILNIMGMIPPIVPWWLEFLAAIGFAGTF
jgi:hypothetical protein